MTIVYIRMFSSRYLNVQCTCSEKWEFGNAGYIKCSVVEGDLSKVREKTQNIFEL